MSGKAVLVRVARVAGGAALALVACRTSKQSPPTIGVQAVDVAAHERQAGDSGGPRVEEAPTGPGLRHDEVAPRLSLFILADGTLVVEGSSMVFARAPDGTSKSVPIPQGASLHVSTELPGVLVEDEDRMTLLATPSLAVLYAGKGKVASWDASAVLAEDERAILLQRGQALLRLPIAKGLEAPVRSITYVAGGARLNVTLTAGDAAVGVLYDAQLGSVVGRGVPLGLSMGAAPPGARAGDVGFVVEGRKLLRLDLRSGLIQRSAAVRCPKDAELGNPTPSPTGAVVLVTCADDGVVLDGVTLAERRRIPRVLPGCDNGSVLDGSIAPDGHTMVLEGCGGQARVDLATGTYACADSPGIAGAPYEVMSGAAGPSLPPGREHLPRCTREEAQTSELGSAHRYRLNSAQTLSVEAAGMTPIVLEESSDYPVLAPDERSFAYARRDKVIVRGLPDGKIRYELTPFAKSK